MLAFLFAQMTAECPYTLQWDAPSPLKIVPSHVDLDPHLIHGYLGPPESSTRMASRSVRPFLQGSLVGQTDRPRYSVVVLRCGLKCTRQGIVTMETRHRASTSTHCQFTFAFCFHSNATRAPIANPPNSAQLGVSPTIPKLHPGQCRNVGMRPRTETQTDTQTHVTTIHFASSTTHAKCN